MTTKLPISIMGILNTTPDSFSDGGSYVRLEQALEQARKLISQGADIIDIGGESSRPGASPVELQEELDRVIPIIKAIRLESTISISIDTTKAEVARQAVQCGANIINDISALDHDCNMIKVLEENEETTIVLMHMQGSPATMQNSPKYENITEELLEYFQQKIIFLKLHGISLDRIIIDPGIGFGKKLIHNIELLKNLCEFQKLGAKVLLGHSRKSFLGLLTDRETSDRDGATAITTALCASRGVDIVRVHDVASTIDALKIQQAIS
ncbi:MAG: dihydropteroate synthase [Desulfotalea sp.]